MLKRVFSFFFPSKFTLPLDEGVWLIDNFLTKSQCEEIIYSIEKTQFKIARQYAEGRHNKEAFSEETEIINLLKAKFKTCFLKSKNSIFQISQFSLPLEFYKYEVGDYIKRHTDAPRVINGRASKLTLIIYLSENCKGGDTFFEKFNLTISPTIGSALLFDQKHTHESKTVTTGTKYILRTNCFCEYYK
jgi:prolyl 4-hydroxylase